MFKHKNFKRDLGSDVPAKKLKSGKRKKRLKILGITYLGILLATLLVAMLCGSSGCAVVTVFSDSYNKYAFQEKRFPYKVEYIESAYLSPENDIIICFRGWLPAVADRVTPRTRDKYTIRISAETFATRSLANNRRRGSENSLSLAPDTLTKGWVTEKAVASENLREIPVVNAWDAEKKTSSAVVQEYGNPPQLWAGSDATVYDIGDVPAPLRPHELRFLYVQKDPSVQTESFSLGPIPEFIPLQQDGIAFSTLLFEKEYVYIHPKTKAAYPLTAPVVFAIDIVSLPVKAGAIVGFVVYFILDPDAFQMF